MTNAELLQLNPKHLAELRSFYSGLDFVDVEIVAREQFYTLNSDEFATCEFGLAFNKLRLDCVFCGGDDHTHALFTKGEDDIFYCVSYVRDGDIEDRAIFKLIRR